MKLDLLLGFGAHTYLHVLSVILGVCILYFVASRILLYKIGWHMMCWCLFTKNSMPRQFPASPELIPNYGIVAEDWKSARHHFFVLEHQQVVCRPVTQQNTRWAAKYASWTPIISYFACKPVFAQNTPQNGMYFAHTRFWVPNTKYWEFSAHIAPAIVSNDPRTWGI